MGEYTPSFGVEGRVALVTGASSGLGRTIATALAEAGAKVVGIARRSEKLEEWRRQTDGATAPLVAEIGDADAIAKIARLATEPFGPPDILVNAAGVNTRQTADEVTPHGWQQTIDLNLSAPFYLAQALVPAMREQGWGRILNFASLQSERAFPGGIAYGASKGGVVQMTRAMAEAWSRYGVNANALAPGFFPTELTEAVFAEPERAASNAAQTCIGRNGEAADIVGPAMFFCSPASNYVTGQTLFVDGGYTAK